MTYALEKCSLPNVWRKEFATESEIVDELRRHICGICLRGDEFTEPGEADFKPVDVEFEGRIFECRDVNVLLGTACGLEYELEETP